MPYKDPEQRKLSKARWRIAQREKHLLQLRDSAKRYRERHPNAFKEKYRARVMQIPYIEYTDEKWIVYREKRKQLRKKSKRRISSQSRKKQRRRVSDWIWQYKAERCCIQCGYSHPAALQFHHVRDNKKKAVSACTTFAEAKREIEKCELLCANCHAVKHYDIKKGTHTNKNAI